MSLDFLFEDDAKKYSIVDLSQIALATAMFTFESGEKFTVEKVRQLIISTLKHNVLKFKAEGFNNVIIAVDNSKKGYWRRQFRDYYKRNRAIAREENTQDFDWDGYFLGLNTVVEELKENTPYFIIDVTFAEADDIIAVLTKYLTERGHFVRIISSDGDFTQLHKYKNVDQYSPIQKKFVQVKGSCPEEDCLAKIIKGDKKDCVASIKVRGNFYITNDSGDRTPPTSASYITDLVGKSDEFVHEYILADVLKKITHKKDGAKNCSKLLTFQGKDVSNIIFEDCSKEQIEMIAKKIAHIQFERFKENRILIDFDYIRDDIKESILNEFTNYAPAPKGKLYSYLVKNGLGNLTAKINDF